MSLAPARSAGLLLLLAAIATAVSVATRLAGSDRTGGRQRFVSAHCAGHRALRHRRRGRAFCPGWRCWRRRYGCGGRWRRGGCGRRTPPPACWRSPAWLRAYPACVCWRWRRSCPKRRRWPPTPPAPARCPLDGADERGPFHCGQGRLYPGRAGADCPGAGAVAHRRTAQNQRGGRCHNRHCHAVIWVDAATTMHRISGIAFLLWLVISGLWLAAGLLKPPAAPAGEPAASSSASSINGAQRNGNP